MQFYALNKMKFAGEGAVYDALTGKKAESEAIDTMKTCGNESFISDAIFHLDGKKKLTGMFYKCKNYKTG